MIEHTNSIGDLRVYKASRALEDAVYGLVNQLPPEEFYGLGNDLRRSSAAVSHYINECHRRYSYSVKLEALHLARTEVERLQELLAEYETRGFGATRQLQNAGIGVLRQCRGLIKYFKQRQAEHQIELRAQASDQLVAARA